MLDMFIAWQSYGRMVSGSRATANSFLVEIVDNALELQNR